MNCINYDPNSYGVCYKCNKGLEHHLSNGSADEIHSIVINGHNEDRGTLMFLKNKAGGIIGMLSLKGSETKAKSLHAAGLIADAFNASKQDAPLQPAHEEQTTIYMRDIDGTGSLHPCASTDKGAVEFRSVLKYHPDKAVELVRKAGAYEDLERALGYVVNCTNATVKIYQDDATREWCVSSAGSRFNSINLIDALNEAANHNSEEPS